MWWFSAGRQKTHHVILKVGRNSFHTRGKRLPVTCQYHSFVRGGFFFHICELVWLFFIGLLFFVFSVAACKSFFPCLILGLSFGPAFVLFSGGVYHFHGPVPRHVAVTAHATASCVDISLGFELAADTVPIFVTTSLFVSTFVVDLCCCLPPCTCSHFLVCSHLVLLLAVVVLQCWVLLLVSRGLCCWWPCWFEVRRERNE